MTGILPVDEYFLEAGVDEVGHQGAVVSPHRLDALAVHLVIGLGARKVQPRVTLLVDEQVREIHL